MINPLITLGNTTSLIADFKKYLNTGNNVIFVVLGNTAANINLANAAAKVAENWRLVIFIPKASNEFYTFLSTLNKVEGLSFPPNPIIDLYAIVIAFDGDICYVFTDGDVSNIIPAFLLTETH
jgi:hypothetical protein